MPPLSLITSPPEPPSPLRGTAVVAFAIFVLGTLGYAFGVTAWSGREVAVFAVPAGAVSDEAVAGGDRAPGLGPVHLDPAMNPVRVLVHVGYHPPPGPDATCLVTLRDSRGRPVWSENRGFDSYSIGHSSRYDRGRTLVIETFSVTQAGDYAFAVAFDPRTAGVIQDARIEVRRQVASVQLWFVILGSALALASLAVVLLAAPITRSAASERSHAA